MFVDDITAATTVRMLKDTILCTNLKMSTCQAQCYDGASNGKKAAVEIMIKSLKSCTLYLHCYGHSLKHSTL